MLNTMENSVCKFTLEAKIIISITERTSSLTKEKGMCSKPYEQ
jgi:hypothetical protein